MGYEMELVIGAALPSDDDDAIWKDYHRKYGRGIIEYGRVKLSGIGNTSKLGRLIQSAIQAEKDARIERGYKLWHISTGYVTSAGNEKNTFNDKYGDPVACIPLQDIYDALLIDQEDSKQEYSGSTYRRLDLARGLIEVVINRFPEHRPVALTFGY